MTRTIAALRALTLALFIAGCIATPEIRETREAPAANLAPGEAITIVSLIAGPEKESADCVAEAIRELEAEIKIVAPQAFRDGMFPWFEPGTAPTTADGLARLMEQPLVHRKIATYGVRYVVAIGGESASDLDGWGGGFGAHGVGVVVGGFNWTTATRLVATILDLKQARPVGEVSAAASGGGGAGILLIFPYIVPSADTGAITCQAIAERVVGFLKGEAQPPDQTREAKEP